MKVITEEWIKNSIVTAQKVSDDGASDASIIVIVLNAMLKHCQELDTLTVTRLRPMCELACYDGLDILLFHTGAQRFVHAAYINHSHEWFIHEFDCNLTTLERYEGFIPMPRYEPEKV